MSLFSFLSGRKKTKASFSIPLSLDPYKKYMASNVPLALKSYNLFKAEFLMSYASFFMEKGTAPKLTPDDVLPGVDLNKAYGVLVKTTNIVAARFHQKSNIKQAIDAGARFVVLKVSRGCPGCDRVPKEKKYKSDSSVPLYPCLDCAHDVRCDVYYTFEF